MKPACNVATLIERFRFRRMEAKGVLGDSRSMVFTISMYRIGATDSCTIDAARC